MIDVDYRVAKHFGNDVEVTPSLVRYYKSVMNAWIDTLRSYINLEKLGGFVITDNFIEDVLDFQVQQHYHYPRVTNNEMGRAMGKTLLAKDTCLYTIFLDEQLGSMLLDDNMFDIVATQFDDDYKADMAVRRRLAVNILAHELSHVEFETVTDEPDYPVTYEGEAGHLAWLLADEYYAVRNAAMIEPVSMVANDVAVPAQTEAYILKKRREYNLREISIDDFGRDLFEFTRLALIYGVSAIADACGMKTDVPAFSDCKFSAVAKELSAILGDTYERVKAGNGLIPCEQIAKSVIAYHRQFEVFASDTPAGLYLDVPVRL